MIKQIIVTAQIENNLISINQISKEDYKPDKIESIVMPLQDFINLFFKVFGQSQEIAIKEYPKLEQEQNART
jgi:hypothetical protein